MKDNGKVYDITMDEGLTAAMKAFEPDKFASYGAAKAMKKLNDLFKALCTGYNPFFMVRNLARDMQDAGFYSTDSATWAKMFPSAWTQIAKNGEIWQQYKALGGSYASMLDYTTGMVKEPKNALGKAAAWYESLGQAIEAAPRLAEFMTILANKGGSKTVDGVKTGKFTQSDLMEAMLGAADITTNFARGGSVTKALNRYLVPFLNPSIQGFDKFIRNATETRSVKAAGSLILKAALMGIAPALLNALAYRDDDEWDDIPANTKANYYLINAGKWLGDGYWIKIPKGRAIAVLSTAAVYGKEKIDGEDVKFSDVFEVIKSNIAPTDIFNQNIATAWTRQSSRTRTTPARRGTAGTSRATVCKTTGRASGTTRKRTSFPNGSEKRSTFRRRRSTICWTSTPAWSAIFCCRGSRRPRRRAPRRWRRSSRRSCSTARAPTRPPASTTIFWMISSTTRTTATSELASRGNTFLMPATR